MQFLEDYNGGEVENNIIELHSEEIESFSLSTFFGMKVEYINDILSCYNAFKKRIPKGCVPIGRDVGGNIVCLNLNKENFGNILLGDHDIELDFEENEMGDYFPSIEIEKS
ncbi:SMI1/KNR4 family protein [Priestia filamentosa]|uniref:SMI1/KNR4 family protein n=1 Tax=Priestia filamentosa TaxID=1402861 RepID=UPI00397BF03D